ncbi:MAG: hypothetical protein J6J51_00975 [Clostridia bacterium]|nr:hypothetical protein [Clostridia bacterium]
MTKLKQRLTVGVLAVLLIGGMLLHLLLPDAEISKAERRKLAKFPPLTIESLQSPDFSEDLEDYLLDHFPLRDGLRTVKSLWTYYALGQMDNNGVFLAKDNFSDNTTASKLDPTLDEQQVGMFINKFNALHGKHFPDSEVHCLVVPDKNYYLSEAGYPAMDYEAMLTMLEEGMPWADVRRNLFNCLISDSYYTTDSHWRQENLQWVLDDLELILDVELPDIDTYEQTILPGFHGVYYGQAALPMAAEDLIYLESEVTQNAVVTGPELKGAHSVYAPEKFGGMDGYDVFLHGAQAVLTIENPLAETDRELILFRDSFGSSLAPLLLPAYKTVTLVDIRYVNSLFLDQFVDFHGQDVLILYSTTLINSAAVLQ